MAGKTDGDKKGEAGERKGVSPGEAAAVDVIDAGPAPIDQIRRAQALSAEVRTLKAPRARGGPPYQEELDLPLNPLRAGADIARGKVRPPAKAPGGALVETDADGGGAPKLAAKPRAKAKTKAKAKPRAAKAKAKPRPKSKKRKR